MEVYLTKQWKNHPAKSRLDVSKRIYNHLLKCGVISKPEPEPDSVVEFSADVIDEAGEVKRSKAKAKKK